MLKYHRNLIAQRLSNSKTKPKILLAVAIPMFFIFVIVLVTVLSLQRMHSTQLWVDHTKNVLRSSNATVAAAVDMETGMRGYLLAGEEQFLEPYNSGSERAFGLLRDLQQTVSDNPPQVERLQTAEGVLQDWRSNVAEPQIELRRAIGDSPTMNDMAARVAKAEGKASFDAFRSTVAKFIDVEEKLLVERQARFEAITGTGEASRRDIQEMVNWVTHTYGVIGVAKDILAAAVDIETGMRGYLLAGQEEFLEPLNEGRGRFATLVTGLSETVSDNPAQVERLSEIQAVIGSWNSTIVNAALEFRREIGSAKTMDDMADLIGEERGKVYFDEFRQLMSDFAAIEEELMVQRQASNDSSRILAQVSIGLVALISLLLGGAIALLIGNEIGRSIKAIAAAMRKLADGDNDTEVFGLERQDEIGEMARATDVFKQNARKVQELNQEREADAQRMAALAAEREESTRLEMEEAQKAREAEKKEAIAQAKTAEELAVVVAACAAGDFTQRVPLEGKNGIFRDLCAGVNDIASGADVSLSEVETCLKSLSEGDLTVQMEGEFSGAYERLQTILNEMIQDLRDLIGGLSERSENLAGSSKELNETSDVLTRQTEQNAASLEESASALEELSASLKSVDKNAKTADESARLASETAETSGQVAADAADSMQQILKASHEITRSVSVINDISFQINLLALNAGVEAARAGEAGRGFSVVASEVRALAQRASEAVDEIADVLSRSDAAVSVGVAKVADAEASFSKITEAVVDISGRVRGISTSIEEQVHGVEELNAAIAVIDRNTQRQAASFEELTAASSLISEEANGLEASTYRFKTGHPSSSARASTTGLRTVAGSSHAPGAAHPAGRRDQLRSGVA